VIWRLSGGKLRVLDGQDVVTRLDTGRPVATGRFIKPQFDALATVGGTEPDVASDTTSVSWCSTRTSKVVLCWAGTSPPSPKSA
jgi:hypothetical protein